MWTGGPAGAPGVRPGGGQLCEASCPLASVPQHLTILGLAARRHMDTCQVYQATLVPTSL